MKANELRIGNYLIYEDRYLIEVTKIDSLEDSIMGEVVDVLKHVEIEDFYVETTPELTIDNPNYEPIPLTEEWLLRFGFEKHEVTLKLYYSDFKHEDRFFRFYWPENGGGGSLHLKPDDTEWYPDLADNIKYVHQLQNLYFALTGNELEIK